MKNQLKQIVLLRSLVLAVIAACVTATSLQAQAFGETRGGMRRGGGFEQGRGEERGGFDGDRRGRDDRHDRGSRRGDLHDAREVARLVDLIYIAALDRRADRAGLDGFSREILQRGTQGLYDSARMIGSSPEFAQIVRMDGSRRVVVNLYRVFFNRYPDPSGLYNWTRLLDEGRGGDVLHGIVASEEFFQNQLY